MIGYCYTLAFVLRTNFGSKGKGGNVETSYCLPAEAILAETKVVVLQVKMTKFRICFKGKTIGCAVGLAKRSQR